MALRIVKGTRHDVQPGQLPADLKIAPMRRWHVSDVLDIEEEIYPHPWTRRLFLSELALGKKRSYQIAKSAGQIVGYSGLMFGVDEAHITTIAVDPAWQRQKIGSRLMLNMIDIALEEGFHHMTLEVRVSNQSAQRLYHKFGFSPSGIRRNYYVEDKEDGLIMWAEDIDGPAYSARLDHIEAELSQ